MVATVFAGVAWLTGVCLILLALLVSTGRASDQQTPCSDLAGAGYGSACTAEVAAAGPVARDPEDRRNRIVEVNG